MPVTDEIVENLCRQSPDLPDRALDGFSKLSEPVARAAERLSRHGAIVYVETDYFGGIGGQSAAVWEQGRLSLSGTRPTTSAPSMPRWRCSVWRDPLRGMNSKPSVLAGSEATRRG
jgi:hypothetical protein